LRIFRYFALYAARMASEMADMPISQPDDNPYLFNGFAAGRLRLGWQLGQH
jgi:hypothetical protein